jgi:hypothetical protein
MLQAEKGSSLIQVSFVMLWLNFFVRGSILVSLAISTKKKVLFRSLSVGIELLGLILDALCKELNLLF